MRIFFLVLAVVALTAVPARAYNENPPRVGVTTQTLYGASSVSTQALTANDSRGYLYIQNQSGASTLTISFKASSTIGIQLTSGQSWFTDAAPLRDPVYLQSSAGIVNALILEGIH